MKSEHEDMMIKGGAALAGVFVLKALEKGYEKKWQEAPPTNPVDRELDWRKIALWTLASGLVVNATKLIVSRGGARVRDRR